MDSRRPGVGIDVSKAQGWIRSFGRAGANLFSVANDSEGIRATPFRRLGKLWGCPRGRSSHRGLGTAVVAELGLAGLPVVVLNPRQVRDFARCDSGSWPGPIASTRGCWPLFGERIRP